MPQVKTVTCSVTVVTQPHSTLVTKPLRVCAPMPVLMAVQTPSPRFFLGPKSLATVTGKC